MARFVRATAQQAKQFDTSAFADEALKKQFGYVTFEGMSTLNVADAEAFSTANSNVSCILTSGNKPEEYDFRQV